MTGEPRRSPLGLNATGDVLELELELKLDFGLRHRRHR
jgi:hypothetical protein